LSTLLLAVARQGGLRGLVQEFPVAVALVVISRLLDLLYLLVVPLL
jgi:hypothetical protein